MSYKDFQIPVDLIASEKSEQPNTTLVVNVKGYSTVLSTYKGNIPGEL